MTVHHPTIPSFTPPWVWLLQESSIGAAAAEARILQKRVEELEKAGVILLECRLVQAVVSAVFPFTF